MPSLDLRERADARAPRSPRARRARPCLEPLESRTVPYAATSNAWPHPGLVTISFEPDGTDLGSQVSNLFADFNGAFGSASAWQNPILKAAQAWAQQTNLNFAVIGDNGADSGAGNYQQGDPGFGDIRIGGFAFGNSSVLALGYMPPSVNNYSVAGDVAINTAQVFNINGLDYDLYTVILHEFGHVLGLNHSSTYAARMYPDYEGVESGLNADDIAGIRAIYGGARSADGFDAAAANGSFAAASDITSRINASSLTAALGSLNVSSTSDVDYYKVVAPAGSSDTLRLTVQSSRLSLLAPSVRVYDANQQQLAAATGGGYRGSTLTLNVAVSDSQTYYVRVAGANTTSFGTGAYAMTLNFGSGTSPAVRPQNTQTANGNPLNGGGGVANRRDADGVSVSFLISGVGNLADGLGLGLVGDLLGGLNQALSGLELPYADVLTIGDGRFEHKAAAATTGSAQQGPQAAAAVPAPLRADGWSVLAAQAVAITPTAAGPSASTFVVPAAMPHYEQQVEARSPQIEAPVRPASLNRPAATRIGQLAGSQDSGAESMEQNDEQRTDEMTEVGADPRKPLDAACDAFFGSLAPVQGEALVEDATLEVDGELASPNPAQSLPGLALVLGPFWVERRRSPPRKQAPTLVTQSTHTP